jgi:hypothetical protein
MKIVYTYYKNSNTGELKFKQEFKETKINFPDNFYDKNHKETNSDLTGYVQISEKHFKKLEKK